MFFVLEDDVSNLEVFASILGFAGHNVLKACTGQESMEAARRQHWAVDLLVSDLRLKGSELSGTDVAIALEHRVEHLPILFVSGWALADWNDRDRRNLQLLQLLPSSQVRVLEKPFFPVVFQGAVNKLLVS
jgi:CheY-like chemotaxis protein